MSAEPLKSAMSVSAGGEDTSLALPSDNALRSGQRRVLDQVHTIKRGKSKSMKVNGQVSLSPTAGSAGNSSTTYSEFGTFRFAPSRTNGTFNRSQSNITTGFSKMMKSQKNRSMSTKASGGRYHSTSGWDQHIQTSTWPQGPNGLKPSRSDPSLAPPALSYVPAPAPAPAPVMRAKPEVSRSQNSMQMQRHSTYSMTNGTQMTNSQTRMVQAPFSRAHTEGKMGTMKISKTELQQSAVSSGINISDLTLKEAIEYLSHADDNYQQCGATFIQHTTFKEERAKQEVFQLGGIPALVGLLRSPNAGVSQAAAGALRNLVFKAQNNKQEVQHCGGIGKALQLLKESDSTETQKQITGLLWNLSSADDLKGELTMTALPALTENVVVPYTCWSDNSANNNIHPDVFFNATGCLRNLSCGQQAERKAMRECSGLIDSLMSYVQSCVAEETPDDKSVENCACILHNLTYQLESESPESFQSYYPPDANQPGGRKNSTVGCFSPKSSKAQKQFMYDMDRALPEDSSLSGVKWLSHPKAMQTYLSLLSSSQKDATLEASCGALQNLTASRELGSTAVTRILAQRLGALPHISPLLKSPNGALQRTAMALLSNMCRTSSVQPVMARQILPELTGLLASGPRVLGKCDDTIAAACSTTRALMAAEPEVSKKLVNNELVTSLADLSENGAFPKANKAASLLLYNLWNDKNCQGVVKKLGLAKNLFINDNTTAVHRSAQVIE